MKKILVLLLAMAMVLGLVACGGNGSSSQPGSDSSTPGSSDSSNNAPSDTNASEGEGGTIMFLSVSSSGPTYDATVAFLEGMGDALGYDIKVVYGDPFNDPGGNLTAVKNGMTNDVVALITMQDGGIQNIMDEYPDLYVVGYNKGSEIIIMECPTRGVDVGVKQFMYQQIMEMKRAGKAILMISEELSELIGMADRLLIMKDFKIAKEFSRAPDLSPTDIVDYMVCSLGNLIE